MSDKDAVLEGAGSAFQEALETVLKENPLFYREAVDSTFRQVAVRYNIMPDALKQAYRDINRGLGEPLIEALAENPNVSQKTRDLLHKILARNKS